MTGSPLDLRGLACPEPAMRTREALSRAASGEVVVIVDSATSRDNVERTARLAHWRADVEPQPDGSFRLVLRR